MINLRREANAMGLRQSGWCLQGELPARKITGQTPIGRSILDTLPYNAHATRLTRFGSACFGHMPRQVIPGLVAASLLQAVGLPELVTESLVEYEKLAWSLATNPDHLAAISRS